MNVMYAVNLRGHEARYYEPRLNNLASRPHGPRDLNVLDFSLSLGKKFVTKFVKDHAGHIRDVHTFSAKSTAYAG